MLVICLFEVSLTTDLLQEWSWLCVSSSGYVCSVYMYILCCGYICDQAIYSDNGSEAVIYPCDLSCQSFHVT